jgi:hypothetical protein
MVMAILTFEIKDYEVLLGSKIGVGLPNMNYAYALITCTGAANEKLTINFGDVPVQGQSNYTNMPAKRGGIAVPMSHFDNYLNTLRYEKPIYGQICDTSPGTLNILKTTQEPVGEGE